MYGPLSWDSRGQLPTPCLCPGWIHAGIAGTTPSGYHKREEGSGLLLPLFPSGCSATAAADQHANPHMPGSVPMEIRDCQELCKKASRERHFPAGNSTYNQKHTSVFKPECAFTEKRETFFPPRHPAQHSKYLGAVDFFHGMQRRCSVFIWLRSELELRAG